MRCGVDVSIHELKTWPAMFRAIAVGVKTHEIRKADRDYKVGDVLRLFEWDGVADGSGEIRGYTGSQLDVFVTFITRGGEWGIPDELCVMSIRCLTGADYIAGLAAIARKL